MSGTQRQQAALEYDRDMTVSSGVRRQEPGASQDIMIAREAAGAIITLNRPEARNALNAQMFAAISAALPGFARNPEIYALILRSSDPRAFSAGGDVREIADLGRADVAAASRHLGKEYAINWALECYTKPILSLIDGFVMGSGVGLTLYGTHRVAGERYCFAMPETGLGFFPDVGVSNIFARMPHEIGMYLGLTGRAIGRADAYRLGLVTHCIDAQEFAAITAAVCDADPVDPLLDERHEDPGPGELAGLAPLIGQCFSASSVETIIANLRAVRGAQAGWALACAEELALRAPLALKVTHRLIRAAGSMDLRQTLQCDYRLACRFLGEHDFYEGVRAALIDKDKRPRWRPSRLEDISQTRLDNFFMPLGKDELILPERNEVQTARN